MAEFIHQIGVDWKLLAGQAVNFLILLVILRAFLYKPLLKVLKERRARIEEGIEKAKVADERLLEVNELTKKRMHQAEEDALVLLRKTEEKARQEETRLLAEAERKEAAIIAKAHEVAKAKEEELHTHMEKEAQMLVRNAVAKACELDPSKIDEALIKNAVAAAGLKKA